MFHLAPIILKCIIFQVFFLYQIVSSPAQNSYRDSCQNSYQEMQFFFLPGNLTRFPRNPNKNNQDSTQILATIPGK